jgi:EAL domain-containing protein (putative c-di-GMP-specific phosphodiesterase class I)
MKPHSIADLLALAATHPALGERLRLGENGYAIGHFGHDDFISEYQPIFDVGVGGTTQSLAASPESADLFGDEVGFEATLRLVDRVGSPRNLFAAIEDDSQLVGLDRLARALHAINFFGSGRASLLFLNVHERLLKSVKYDHGRHFSEVLLSFGLNPARIVIQLPEAAVAHRTFVGYLIKSYQSYGFKVAGNLPNAGQILTVAGIARLDFVKIDAANALRDAMVKPLVGYANRLKVPLIFKNVDDAAQFKQLQQYDVRYVQGRLFTPRKTTPLGQAAALPSGAAAQLRPVH